MTIVARTLSHGVSSGITHGVGTVVGVLTFLTLAVFRLSAPAAEMGSTMTVLCDAGAAYLVWVGLKLWTAEPVIPDQQASDRRGLGADVATGIASIAASPRGRSSGWLCCRA